jgi:LEA14-like dessication related protein
MHLRTLVILALVACEPAPPPPVVKPPDPELTLTKKVLEAGVCETRMRLTFSLKNSRSETLRVAKWEADVVINDAPPIKQEKTIELKLFSQDEATFDVPLSVDRGCGTSQPVTPGETNAVDRVKVKGQIFAVAAEDLVFEFEDSFELQTPKQPVLDAELRGQKYDYGRVDMYLVFTLRNPNGFSLLVDDVTYKLKLGSEVVAQGEVMAGERVRDNAKARREIPIEMPKQATQELMRRGKIDFSVEATLNLGGSPKPYSKSGTFSF